MKKYTLAEALTKIRYSRSYNPILVDCLSYVHADDRLHPFRRFHTDQCECEYIRMNNGGTTPEEWEIRSCERVYADGHEYDLYELRRERNKGETYLISDKLVYVAMCVE